jgi:putative phosphonate metabolism protein
MHRSVRTLSREAEPMHAPGDMTDRDGARYAIYFAPPVESALYRFGTALLGRDAITGARVAQLSVDGLTRERWKQITEAPKVYGFHATLKPPFRLVSGVVPEMLVANLEQFAAERRSFHVPGLRVARIANFVALVLQEQSHDFGGLADACVEQFDRFRAPLSANDVARRSPGRLTARQRELLEQWGYPYVFEEWRFHMTLASQLEPGEADHVCDVLASLATPFRDRPLMVDAVCLFVQPAPGAAFHLTRRFLFGDGVRA